MSGNLDKASRAYQALYSNVGLLVQAHATNSSESDVQKLVEDCAALNCANIHVMLVSPPDPRLRGMIQSKLSHGLHVDPCAIQYSPEHGVRPIDVGTPRPLVVIEAPQHIHAEDITLQLVRQNETTERINEVLLLTERGALRDTNGEVVLLMSQDAVQKLLANDYARIGTIGADVRRQITLVQKMLLPASKVVMTGIDGLRSEIENVWGSGTLFYQSNTLRHSALRPDVESEIFDTMYERNVAEGNFRPRDQDELAILKSNHFLLRAKNSPLGGFSITSHDDGWKEITAVWSGYRRPKKQSADREKLYANADTGNGVGIRLLSEAMERVRTLGSADRNADVFSLSAEELTPMFTHAGFTAYGPISIAKKRSDMPRYVQEYAHNRDPHVFVRRENTTNAHPRD